MSATFYGVLGVEPDADGAEIRAAYRERVTEVHPDVNDHPDAHAQFRRLTTARETLLDGAERARYDRLGHAAYVSCHVDCSAWTDCRPVDSPDDGPGGDEATRPTGARAESVEQSGTPTNRADTTTVGTAASGDSSSGEGSRDDHRSSGTAGVGGRHDRRQSAWSAANATTGTAASGPHVESSFWRAERTGDRSTPAATSDSFAVRLLRALRVLGPWLFVHAAFLAAAIGTSLYVYVVLAGPDPSAALVLVLVGEVGVAFLLSSVHVVSRLTR